MSEDEYEEIRSALIASLSELRSPHQAPLMEFVKAREDVDSGRFCARIYPDILFWLADGYGVGWELLLEPIWKSARSQSGIGWP